MNNRNEQRNGRPQRPQNPPQAQGNRPPRGVNTPARPPQQQPPRTAAPRNVQRTAPRTARPPQYDTRMVEAERMRRREMQYREEQRRRQAAGMIAVRIVITVIMYLLICGVTVLGFFIKLSNTNTLDTSKYTYTYGTVTETADYLTAKDDRGKPLINFTQIAVLCQMTATGDSVDMRYISIDSSTENVRFVIGTPVVYMNGMQERMSGKCRTDTDGDLWVPLDFVSDFMLGITVEYNESANKITVSRNEAAGSTEDEPLYEAVGYRVKSTDMIEAVTEESAEMAEKNNQGSTSSTGDKLEFINDLSAYEKYMNPTGDDYLVLVNYENLLDSDYIPNDLIDVVNTRADRAKCRMRECAEKALEAMFMELQANGYTDVSVTSAYRSYQTQKELHDGYIAQELAQHPDWTQEQAKAEVLTYSAEPGTSEHQTGLCVDMHNLSGADQSFAREDAYKWLKDNAHKFGFIIRFPEGKEDITQISFEPWHYRFVGRAHATKMYESGMCLEEYVASLK